MRPPAPSSGTASAAAYAVLGLEPGADRVAIERAYRELIKRYHPDRSGGDAERAAEINRAYFELRLKPRRQSSVDVVPRSQTSRNRSSRSRRGRRPVDRDRDPRQPGSALWPVLLIITASVATIERQRLAEAVPRWIAAVESRQAAPLSAGRASAIAKDSTALDGPLDEPTIASSIELALRLAGRGDEEALANRSRDCHRRMRTEPDLTQLDRCAAFDNAVASIDGRDAMNDSGVFSASAITARQMTAASLLSSDYLAIERRLDRIRTIVQLTLRPAAPDALPSPRETSAPPDEI